MFHRLFTKGRLVPACAIVLLGLLVYSNTFKAPFELDDKRVISESRTIKDLSYFGFNAPHELYQDNGTMAKELDSLRRRYAGFFSFALNYRVHGLDVTGYHIVNLVIHLSNALLVFALLLVIFRTPYFPPERDTARENLTALFCALIFVCHPVQTQAVTYIVQRFTSLAALFYLLSLVFYLVARTSGAGRARYVLYAGSMVSAVLAMETKESAFTLPITVALCEFFFFKGKRAMVIAWLLPVFLAMPALLLTIAGGIGHSLKLANPQGIPKMDYLFTQFRVIVTYLRLMFPPVVQNFDYDYPVFHSFFDNEVFLSFLFLLSLAAGAVYLFFYTRRAGPTKELRLVSLGIAWFFVTLSVESGIIPINDVIFEHRMYLPSVGIIVALVASVLVIRDKVRGKMLLIERAIIPGLAVFVLILAGAAYARNSVWQDEVKLWEDTVSKSSGKARPHYNLGLAYFKHNRIPEAIDEFKFVVSKVDFDDAYYNLGLSYFVTGNLGEAIKAYQAALRSNPEYMNAHSNLGVAYAQSGDFERAAGEFRFVLKHKPDDGDARSNLNIVCKKLGDRREICKTGM